MGGVTTSYRTKMYHAKPEHFGFGRQAPWPADRCRLSLSANALTLFNQEMGHGNRISAAESVPIATRGSVQGHEHSRSHTTGPSQNPTPLAAYSRQSIPGETGVILIPERALNSTTLALHCEDAASTAQLINLFIPPQLFYGLPGPGSCWYLWTPGLPAYGRKK